VTTAHPTWEATDERKSVTIRYYNYCGWSMKDELISYYNLSTGYQTVCRGSRTASAAYGMSGVILDLAGYGSVAIALFNSAINAYQAYAEISGTTPVCGSYEDCIQIKLNYDICTKYTYADPGYGDGYRLGAVTQKVRLIDAAIIQYYVDYNGGREVTTHKELNGIFLTGNFKNPAPVAAANVYMPWVEKITAEICRHPIVF